VTENENESGTAVATRWTSTGLFGVTFGAAFRSSFGNPAAIAALAVPLAPIAMFVGLSAWLVPGSAVLSDGAPIVVDAPAWFTLAQLVVVGLGIAALVFGATSASSAVISDLTGSYRNAAGAWGSIARRLPGHLVIAALLGAIVAFVLTLASVCAVNVGWWLGVVVVLVAIIVAAPLVTAPAMLILGDDGPVNAVRDAALVTRWSRGAARARIVVGLVIAAALPIATMWLTAPLDGSVLTVLARDLLRFIALVAGALIAVVVPTVVALEARVPGRRELPATTGASAPVIAAALSVGALLLPPAATAGVSVLNPGNVARVTTVEADGHWEDVEVTPFGEGALVLSRIGDAGAIVTWCDAAACSSYDSWGSSAQAIHGLADGSVLLARLVPQHEEVVNVYTAIELQVTRIEPGDVPSATEDDDREPYFPGDFTGATTAVLLDEVVPEESSRSADFWEDTAVAVSLGADAQPVVALMTRGPAGDGLLRVFRCADLDCSTSGEVAAVDLQWAYPFAHAKWAILGVADLPDGTIGIAVVQQDHTEAPLRYVAVTEGETPVVQALDDSPTPYDSADGTAGARVAVNGDGTVTLAYRPHGSMDGYILTCVDSECSDHTTEKMLPSGTDPFFPSPTLAIDDTGRPMYLQRDPAGAVRLVSCLDVACTETVATIVADPEYSGGPIALALTTDGRPLIVAAAPPIDPHFVRRVTERSLVLECLDARCGLP